jgi:hypothetical protein
MTSHIANEKYFQLNQKLSETYMGELAKVRYYQNVSMALFDVASGLQQLFAHKTFFAVAKNGCSLIDAVSSIWIRSLNPLQIKNEAQHWVEFVESLHAETNFVVWASENEITGEVLVDPALAQEIHQRLSQKRIYSIQICHHVDASEKLFPFAIKIVRPSLFTNSAALAIYTERFKASTQVGSYQNLEGSQKDLSDFFQSYSGPVSTETLKFESQLTNANNAYFNRFVPTTNRLNDRIVLNYSQVNGFALQNELGLADEYCLAPSKYPFWVLNLWRSWWKEAENEIFLRGLLVLSIHAVRKDPFLVDKINQAVDKFKRLGHLSNI